MYSIYINFSTQKIICLPFQIMSNLFGIHHDERFWDRPWDFLPERFLSENGTLLPEDHSVMQKWVYSLILYNVLLNLTLIYLLKQPQILTRVMLNKLR